jgi:hypothetical protein
VDTAIPEADDVGFPVGVNVCELARIRIVTAPTPRADAEGGIGERGGRKVPASRGQGRVDAGRAEANDVGSPIGVNVCKRARVKVVAGPAAGAGTGTEGGELEGWRPEVAVSRGPGHVHTGRAEGLRYLPAGVATADAPVGP